MGSGSGVKHKLGAGNSAETLNEFVFIYLCVLFTRIFNCRTRGQESQLSCFDVCRVPRPGPVDDKFICLIPTSHAIQHQRRPQTFALLTRRASSNLVIFFLYSVQEIIFSCSFTYIIGGPRVPCENANISPKSIQKWSFGTVKYFVSENGNCYCQHLCNKSMRVGVDGLWAVGSQSGNGE